MKKISSKIIAVIFLVGIAELSYSQNLKTATILSLVPGDNACYVDLKTDRGRTVQNLALYEICDQGYLIGQKVDLFYEQGNVLAASCNGNPDCRRTNTVWLINKILKIQNPIQQHSQPQYSDIPSHCFQNEKVIFSCDTNSNKVISICSSPTLNAHEGYMQYRFGSSGSFPEFVFPMNHGKASQFFYSGQLTYAGGGGAYLKFINVNYNYVVYSGIGQGWAKQGLVINDGANEISRYSCRGNWVSELGQDLFSQAGLSVDRYGFEIPNDNY
jgi:hypothetical protein